MSAVKLAARLKASGFEVAGEEGSKYSFDIIAARNKEVLAIKFVEDSQRENTRKYAHDLKKLSISLDIIPLMICKENIYDDILFTYDGIPSITSKMLEKIMRDEGPPFIYVSKGGVYVKVKGDAIRELRLRKGMSLGDLSLRIGVTRRMVYEYESGRSDVTFEVAEKLVHVLGEEVLEKMSIESIKEHFVRFIEMEKVAKSRRIDDPALKQVYYKLLEMGFLGSSVEKAPFQIAAKRKSEGKQTKLIIRKSGNIEDSEELLTLQVAKLCKSYALLLKGELVEVVGERTIEVSTAENLDKCLKEESLNAAKP